MGAEGRMEMEKVPASGYPIVGLPQELYVFDAEEYRLVFKLRSTRMASSIVC